MAGVYQLAVIPSIGLSPYLPAVLDALLPVVRSVIVVDNGAEPSQALQAWCDRDGVRLQHRPGQNIYATWNEGMDLAEVLAGADVPVCHVLNDDIQITSPALRLMAWHLHSSDWAVLGFDYRQRWDRLDPQSVEVRDAPGTYRKGGIGGFAFSVRPDRCARVDTRFQWWGGDDDLVNATLASSGRVGLLRGCGVGHPEPSYSAIRSSPGDGWAEADKALMLTKWGESW